MMVTCVNTSVTSNVCHHDNESKPFEKNASDALNKWTFFSRIMQLVSGWGEAAIVTFCARNVERRFFVA